eukprot:TRINITY_DN4983_c0_g1_i1.p1 TRINITY_DN4983_c0_g1~~TRINITY_DN4983_c0_g1_i1.p1  ORF type:complete len:142 (-),score=13.07 TRINITY_DN4983_c0_g1_i1:8-379(-)
MDASNSTDNTSQSNGRIEPSPDAGWLERFAISLVQPGITKEHVTVLNFSFIALLLVTLSTLIALGSDASIHLYFFFALSIGLFGAIRWFLHSMMEFEREEKEKNSESKEVATKKDPKRSKKEM